MRGTCGPPEGAVEGAGLAAAPDEDCPVLAEVPAGLGFVPEAARPAHPLVTCPVRGPAALCSFCAADAAAAWSWLAAVTHPP